MIHRGVAREHPGRAEHAADAERGERDAEHARARTEGVADQDRHERDQRAGEHAGEEHREQCAIEATIAEHVAHAGERVA